MKAKSFFFLLLIIGWTSYSQTNNEIPLLGFNIFGYNEEDSQMRINYFRDKPEEKLPTMNYSMNLKDSASFFELCKCESQIINPLIKTLKNIAPNLVYQEDANAEIQIQVVYDLKNVLAAKIKSNENSGSNSPLHFFVSSKYELYSQVNIFKKNIKIASYTADPYKFEITSRPLPSVDQTKMDWHNNYSTYLQRQFEYLDKTFVSKTVINGLKEYTPKPVERFKDLYTARFDKKNKKKHDFGTSDEHLNNVQDYINNEVNSIGVNNILTKREGFDKILSKTKLQEAVTFWKTQLHEKYAGETKYDDVRKGFAFNLLTTSFILRDKENFTYAKNYLKENKFSAKDLYSNHKDMAEYYNKLEEEYLK